MEGRGSPGSPESVEMTVMDFQQFFERDVPFSSYVPKNQDSVHTIGEKYILQRSEDAKYLLKTTDALPFDNTKISCPYCIKLIEKAEKLFIDTTSDKQKELAGVCNHCRRLAKEPCHLSTKSGKGLGALDYLRSRMLEGDKKDRQRKGEHLIKGQIFSRALKRPLPAIQESEEMQGIKRKTKGKDEQDYNKQKKLKSKSKEQQEFGREIDEKSKGPLTSKDDIFSEMKDEKQSKSIGSLTAKDDISAPKKSGKQSKSKGPLTAKDDMLAAMKHKKRSKSIDSLTANDDISAAKKSGIQSKSKGPLTAKDDMAGMKYDKQLFTAKDDISTAKKSGKQSKSKGPLTAKGDILAAMKYEKQSISKGSFSAKDDISATMTDVNQSKSKGSLAAKDDKSKDGKRSKSKEKDETLLAKKDDKNGKSKDDKTGKSKVKAEKSKEKSPSTMALLALIIDEKQKKHEEEMRKKEQERQKKESDLAEKKAQEAEARLKLLNPIDQSSLSIVPSDSDESILKQRATFKKPLAEDFILGQRIYKLKRKRANEEIGVDKTGKSPMNNKSKTTDRASAVTVKSKGLKQELNSQIQEKRARGADAGSEKRRKGPVFVVAFNQTTVTKGAFVKTGTSDKNKTYDGSGKAAQDTGSENTTVYKGLKQELNSQIQKKRTRGADVGSEKLRKKENESNNNKGAIVDTGTSDKTKTYVGSGKAVQDTGSKNTTEDGVMRFNLSDPTFIDKGWTMLPLEKVVRKINVYRMRPAKPEFDWFEHNKGKTLQYSSGEKLATLDDTGCGRVYYKDGGLALDYYNAEETNAGRRFVVYSTGTRDENGRPRPKTVLATFDHSGNGIVYDHSGKTRLKYNQTEGAVLDQKLGAVGNWKWHTLNDPPLLQQVMIDTQLEHKIPAIIKMDSHTHHVIYDEAMLAIERDNLIKEKKKKMHQTFKPFQIKMKALKINEKFSLKVVDQETIFLLFRDGTKTVKINLGMELDTTEIVDTDISEIGEVSNKMDVLPACTESIAKLQRHVAQARASEDHRAARARVWYLPTASVDALRSGISRPLRVPVVACSVCASKPSKASCCCTCMS